MHSTARDTSISTTTRTPLFPAQGNRGDFANNVIPNVLQEGGRQNKPVNVFLSSSNGNRLTRNKSANHSASALLQWTLLLQQRSSCCCPKEEISFCYNKQAERPYHALHEMKWGFTLQKPTRLSRPDMKRYCHIPMFPSALFAPMNRRPSQQTG